MKNIIKWLYTLIATIILCGCTSNERKVEKATKYYFQHGYKPIAITDRYAIHDDKDNYYILCFKNDTIYLDTKFKSRGKSVRKIFPNERGIKIKTLKVDFRNGDGALVPINGFHLDLERIFDVKIKFHDEKCPINKDLLQIGLKDGKEILYYIESDEGLLINDRHPSLDYPKLICEEKFTLQDIYPNNSYLADYPFIITEEFSLADLSFSRLSSMRFSKFDYPWILIKENLNSASLILENDFVFDTHVDFECLEQIHLSVAMDRNMKLQAEYEARQEEQQRAQEEEARQYVLDNAINFYEMLDDYKNPIKAERKYILGTEIILRVVVDNIKATEGAYSYVTKSDYADGDICIYTNDENFVELDYPQVVWVLAKYNARNKDEWGERYTYVFTDASLLIAEKASVWNY